ncbi:hypothetical protein ATANTOWER_011257 [Ataeniobius toweri]|uniref:Uncharacterized protein n=1 Tax=Ataeniobius toweri TaxID=208326 RepID=A0ABU7AP26_9TELE|nr:hypothetical protein [Ataeniobius toweri]
MHPRYGRNKNCAKTCFGPSNSAVDQSAMSHVFHWYLLSPVAQKDELNWPLRNVQWQCLSSEAKRTLYRRHMTLGLSLKV